MIMEKYFCASTIINKYGLSHSIDIIIVGLFIYYNNAMNKYD